MLALCWHNMSTYYALNYAGIFNIGLSVLEIPQDVTVQGLNKNFFLLRPVEIFLWLPKLP